MSEKLQNTLIAIFALLALCALLCHNAKAAEPRQLPFVHPIPVTRPAPTPTYPTPRVSGARQITPTYPEPRVGAELHASGHSFSFTLHARF